MSPPPKPELVVSGPIPIWLARLLVLGAWVVVPVLLAVAFDSLQGAPLPVWFRHGDLGALLMIAVPGCVLTVGASLLGFTLFVRNRAGSVAVHHDGLIWRGEIARLRHSGLTWTELQGYRDTPHPWVVVVGRDRVEHRVPVRSEDERASLLEHLGRALGDRGRPLADLARPPEERAPEPGRAARLLVLSGSLSPGVGLALETFALLVAVLLALGVPLALVEARLTHASKGPLVEWLLALGDFPLQVAVTFVAVGFVAAVVVWVERRTGTIAVFDTGLSWRSSWGVGWNVVVWARFAGFRDTPHPWVEVVRHGGRARRIPVASAFFREQLLLTLGRYLPDLGRPPEERGPRP